MTSELRLLVSVPTAPFLSMSTVIVPSLCASFLAIARPTAPAPMTCGRKKVLISTLFHPPSNSPPPTPNWARIRKFNFPKPLSGKWESVAQNRKGKVLTACVKSALQTAEAVNLLYDDDVLLLLNCFVNSNLVDIVPLSQAVQLGRR
jgi:hypothetical protein